MANPRALLNNNPRHIQDHVMPRSYHINDEQKSIQDEILTIMTSISNATKHFMEKLRIFVTYNLDFGSICIICIAIAAMIVIIISKFCVDIHEANTANVNNISSQQQNIPIPSTSPIINDNDTHFHVVEEAEFETMDDLFKPTPLPVIGQDTDESDNIDDTENDIKYNEWLLIYAIDWKNIQIGQVMKFNLGGSTDDTSFIAEVKSIDLERQHITVKKSEKCGWFIFCYETIDIDESSGYLIKLSKMLDTEYSDVSHADNNNTQEMYDAIDRITEDNNEFKEWVEAQFLQFQEKADYRQQESADTLTEYFDDKLTKLQQMIENQQYVNNQDDDKLNKVLEMMENQQYSNKYNIDDNNDERLDKLQETMEKQQRIIQWILDNNKGNAQNSNNNNNNGSSVNWEMIDNHIEDKMESVVNKVDEKINNLAQQIAHELAKEIDGGNIGNHYRPSMENDDIIKPNDAEFGDGEQKDRIDWTYRVISHSKLKVADNDCLREYGYWIMHNVLSKYNQQCIKPTYKPGDCTPLEFKGEQSGGNIDDNAYITIELYQPIQIKQVSLYHYHSAVLTQTAINAAPKDFQVWASYNLSTWHNLGKFKYDYYNEQHTQYFNVNIDNDDNENYVNVDGVIDDDVTLSDDDDEDIVNQTSVIQNDMSDIDDISMGFKFVAFRLLSNYGGSDYGCIYRLRVFGDVIA